MGFKVAQCIDMPGVNFKGELLAPLGHTLVKGTWMTEDQIIENAKDCDAVMGGTTIQPFSRRVLTALPKCRIVASAGVGYEKVDVDAATELGIVVCNVPDYGVDEVSGMAVTMIMALGRKLIQMNQAAKEKQLNTLRDQKGLMEVLYPVFRTNAETVGVIGCGRIGMTAALKCRGLGMRVIGYDPYVFPSVLKSRYIEPVSLDTLLKESDYVTVHCPHNSETEGMLGYNEFKKMKKTAYFINTARGRVVDEPALVKALQEKLIAGAGLDVTWDEPIKPDCPFIKMPNVYLTGHSAWYSTTAQEEMYGKPVTQVIQAFEGKFPLYAVNPKVEDKWMAKWGKKK
ncbi:MAG: C-terminal binding protein [Dehalococcoidia bacterium]|nr:C-terminal binding protein [Dehalococcoidia bacterium]